MVGECQHCGDKSILRHVTVEKDCVQLFSGFACLLCDAAWNRNGAAVTPTIREPAFTAVQDSGERREFSTGSVRDKRDGKGRFDLISPIALRRLAVHYENGAKKYGDRNWEKGQPLSSYLDSAIRHLFVYLAGDRSEDHLSAVSWNAFAYVHTEEMVRRGKLPAELNDMEGK